MADNRQGKFDFEGSLGRRPSRVPYTPPAPKPPTKWEHVIGTTRGAVQWLRAVSRWARRHFTLLRAAFMVGTVLLAVLGWQWAVQFGSDGFKVEAKKKRAPEPIRQPWEITIEREKQ